MRNIIICKGLPASGKTKWSLETLENFPNAYKRVNKDDLRDMLDGGKYSRDAEKYVLRVRDSIIMSALVEGKHVIVDDTNLATKHEARIRELAKSCDFDVKVTIQDFTDVSLATCLERDAARGNKCGAKVIRDMYNQFLRKDPIEVEYVEEAPHIVICDLDGTLSLLNGRSPYDAATCADDLLCHPVADIIKDRRVILLSGRSDKYEPQTREFLAKHNIEFYDLYMRKEGDFRKDYIVKEEIYSTLIKGKYNVDFILDDRNQIVDMWRRLGLKCLQVAEGNF
jgi:predicted kinase